MTEPEGNEQNAQTPTRSLRRELATLLAIAAISLSLALFLRLCVAQAYEIRGKSMEPTLHDGDRVVLLKIAPTIIPIRRNDIVIFAHPHQPDRDLVKRVVALGGDLVEIQNGEIYVNRKRSRLFLPGARCGHPRYLKIHVPEDAYFVLGDNLANSLDSRDFGCVTHELLKGKVWFRWWPVRGE